MSSKIKIELNREGVRQLLQSSEMMNICESYANSARGRLGEGYAVDSRVGKNRVVVELRAETFRARRDNIKNNSILKSLRG